MTTYHPLTKPRGRFESMSAYQALYGFKPIGPHTSLVKELLREVTKSCETCEGTGLSGSYGGMGWLACPSCHGLGETYAIPLEELEAHRQKVLAAYPDAGVRNWRIPISCPVLNLETGEVMDGCPHLEPEPEQPELFER